MLPLSGVKVLDLSRVLAGPYCAQVLGDLGADVIKIEEPQHGDDTRAWGPPFFETTSCYFLSANRNKRSMALDFGNSEDLQRLHSLIAEADILIENFKVGSLKKKGLDYESLKNQYPHLIYVSITGFGSKSPLAKRPGYDAMIQAMAGMMSITGLQEPTKVGVAITDLTTALYAAVASLAAIREREESKLGQHIELALYDVQVSLLSYLAMNFLSTGKIPELAGNAHPSIVPYQIFETADRPVALAIGNDHQFKIFSQILQKKWHQDALFSSNEMRVKNRQQLTSLIAAEFKLKPRQYWLGVLQDAGVPIGPLQNLQEIAEDPHCLNRQLFCKMSDDKTANIRSPMQFSRTPIVSYQVPPQLGEHQDQDFSSKDR